MPARGLFIATVLVIAVTASAQSQNSPKSPRPSPTESMLLPSDKSNLWGALAFTADGSWATAWTKPSKAEAEGNVAVACAKFGRGECKVISFNGETCAALASYSGTHSRRRSRTTYRLSFSGGGPSVHEAQKAALDYCNADSRTRGRCQLRTTVCGDGR